MYRCGNNDQIVFPDGQEGVVLVTLIMLIVLFGLLAVAVGTLLNQSSTGAMVELNSLRAFYLAEAGLNDSFWELKHGEKLYGQTSSPPGEIGPRSISFHDGSGGGYSVPEPSTEIVSTGTSGGVSRRVKVAIDINTVDFALYTMDSRDVSFERNVEVTGCVFINGDLTVVTPTNVDTNYVSVYLREGCEAHYSNGALFPCVTLPAQPSPPILDTSLYDSLLSRAATEPYSNEFWGGHTVQDTVFINGNLYIGNNAVVSRAGGPASVVVTGAIVIGNRASVEDSISFISGNGIAMVNRVTIGQTEGRSGNLCFARSGIIAIALHCDVNGAVISSGDISIMRTSRVNGLVFTVNNYRQILMGGLVSGALWVGRLSGDILIRRTRIIYSPQNLPLSMPPGVTPPGSSTSVVRAPNSWREVS